MNANYPLISMRKEPVSSLLSALNDNNTLVAIDRDIYKGCALNWVKAQLLDTFRLLGASNSVSSIQIVFLSRRIRNIYFYLSLSELTYFFESLIGGGYGKVYVGNIINPQNIMEALRKFDEERTSLVTSEEKEKQSEYKRNQKPIVDMKFINEVCKRVEKEIKKNKFNVNDYNNENRNQINDSTEF